MFKQALAFALFTATAATAQSGAPMVTACPAGTHYSAIRHSMIKPGKLPVFEQAVADHNAWYTQHKDTTTTTLARAVAPMQNSIVANEAVTITVYYEKPQAAHDAAYGAFTAKYKDSSTLKDEMRVCLPAMAK